LAAWLGRWSINVIYVLYGHLALFSPGRVQEVLNGIRVASQGVLSGEQKNLRYKSITNQCLLAGFEKLAIMSSSEGDPDFCRAAWPEVWCLDTSEGGGVVDLSSS
jgi:hypothetical protein